MYQIFGCFFKVSLMVVKSFVRAEKLYNLNVPPKKKGGGKGGPFHSERQIGKDQLPICPFQWGVPAATPPKRWIPPIAWLHSWWWLYRVFTGKFSLEKNFWEGLKMAYRPTPYGCVENCWPMMKDLVSWFGWFSTIFKNAEMMSMDGRFNWTPLMLGERPLGLIYGKGNGTWSWNKSPGSQAVAETKGMNQGILDLQSITWFALTFCYMKKWAHRPK